MDFALIREPMVVNDISSSDNDVIGDDDSDIVLDDIVIKKVGNLFVLVLGKILAPSPLFQYKPSS